LGAALGYSLGVSGPPSGSGLAYELGAGVGSVLGLGVGVGAAALALPFALGAAALGGIPGAGSSLARPFAGVASGLGAYAQGVIGRADLFALTRSQGDEPEIRAGDRIPGLYRYRDPYDLFPTGDNEKRYGHEWLEAEREQRSWGWYPIEIPSGPEALFGTTEGVLNAGARNDPHHGTYDAVPGIERFEVFATRDFTTRAELIGAIDSFATSYSGQWGLVGCSCRSFQNRLFRTVGLRAVPVAP